MLSDADRLDGRYDVVGYHSSRGGLTLDAIEKLLERPEAINHMKIEAAGLSRSPHTTLLRRRAARRRA